MAYQAEKGVTGTFKENGAPTPSSQAIANDETLQNGTFKSALSWLSSKFNSATS